MARPGVSRGEVQRARQALMKAGKHPSIDAIRIELGNTGSRGTITRYVKEIEAEEGLTQAPTRSLSDELQGFVTNLFVRLEQEAQERFDGLKAGHAEEVRRLSEALDKARGDGRAARLDVVSQEVVHPK